MPNLSDRLSATLENYIEIFKSEKLAWDEFDFEKMGWHDWQIYGIHFGDNIIKKSSLINHRKLIPRH